MRIGQYSDSFLPVVDGVGRVVASYADTLGKMGHEVTVFAPSADMGDLRQFPFSVTTYRTVQMPFRMPYRLGFPQLDIQFERMQKDIPLDIVHFHSPFMTGYACAHVARKRGLPLIGSFHSKYYDDLAQTLKIDALARTGVKFIVDLYEQCDEVWAVSSATAETLISYGYHGPIAVMPNGTELRALDDTVLPALCERYHIVPEVPVLLYVGQMNWKKNIRLILDAAVLLKQRGFSFQLLLFGQGPHSEEIAETVDCLGLRDCTALPGHIQSVRDLDGLYTLASLFVFPSLYDNAPMVVREAAAMGTPAVLIEGSSSAEVVQSGVNGFICENTPESLSAVIRGALANPDALRAAGDAAYQTIPVPWTRLMEQVVQRYETILSQHKA